MLKYPDSRRGRKLLLSDREKADSRARPLIVRAVGDLMFPAQRDPSEDEVIWLRSCLSGGADVVFANLEMPFTHRREAANPGAQTSFAGDPERAPLLQRLGVTCVNIGTNHCIDWGPEGIETTIDILDNMRITHVGAGLNREAAERPALFQAAGRRIGLLGFCKPGSFSAGRRKAGAAIYSHRRTRAAIKALRPHVDILILSLHVGLEFCQYPTPQMVARCREYVALGADIVLCHHTHVLQAIETFGGGVIAYNLGNFMFDNRAGVVYSDSMWRERHQSIILETTFTDGGQPAVRIIPLLLDEYGIPGQPPADIAREITDLLDSLALRLDNISKAEVYSQAVGNVLDREVATYGKLWREKGWRFLWHAIKSFRPRHLRMLLSYIRGKIFHRSQ